MVVLSVVWAVAAVVLDDDLVVVILVTMIVDLVMGVACQGELAMVQAVVPDYAPIVEEQVIWSIVMIFMVFFKLIRLLLLGMWGCLLTLLRV